MKRRYAAESCHVITVEGIGSAAAGGRLHPVQARERIIIIILKIKLNNLNIKNKKRGRLHPVQARARIIKISNINI